MLFYTFFKTLVGKHLYFELKNGIKMEGRLESVDGYLNMKICRTQIIEPWQNPVLDNLEVCNLRGSCIKFIKISPDDVNVQGILDASRYRILMNKNI